VSLYVRNGKYYYDFWLGGVRFHGPTGAASKREAKGVEDAAREQARAQAKRAIEQRTAPMTVSVAFDRFWVEKASGYSGTWGKTVFAALGWMAEVFGPNTLLRDIGPNRIRQAIAKRRGKGVSCTTVNHTLTELLRTVLRRARIHWEQKDLPEIDWPGLKLPEPRERVRELRDHEETKLTASMRADYLPAVRFALISGLRKKELVDLKWSAIDWTAQTITVRGKATKSPAFRLPKPCVRFCPRYAATIPNLFSPIRRSPRGERTALRSASGEIGTRSPIRGYRPYGAGLAAKRLGSRTSAFTTSATRRRRGSCAKPATSSTRKNSCGTSTYRRRGGMHTSPTRIFAPEWKRSRQRLRRCARRAPGARRTTIDDAAMKGSLTIAEYPHNKVRPRCRYCDRRGQYRRERLISQHGACITLPDLRIGIVTGTTRCRRYGNFTPPPVAREQLTY
jgi:hypothetical protein